MKLSFLGAAQTVTGSSHLIEVGGTRIMIDCGMFQGPRTIRERNYHNFPVEPESVDILLLTHAHIDHSGLVPKFFKQGFRGRVIATAATVDLCEVMLPDSGHIQEMEVERKNRKSRRANRKTVEPIYTAEDARRYVQEFERVPYDQLIELDKHVTARFLDAGHILGSSIVEVIVNENGIRKKLVFTGDIGGADKPYVNNPTVVTEADYVIMESTYGNRFHRDKDNRVNRLKEVIEETYHKGGNLVIPAFAVERTQDLLYDINALYIAGEIPSMDVYIDSPMAVAATEVFKRHPECFDTETKSMVAGGNDPLTMPLLRFSRTTDESRALNKVKGGAIILSASGMCDAGRIKHHLKHNLWRPECTVLFVGYQAPGTKGQRLLSGVSAINIHGEEVAVKADIRNIDGYSSHADQNGLLEWLGRFESKPEQVFLVHGAPDALEELEKQVSAKLGYNVYVPDWKESINLTAGMETGAEDVMESYAAISPKLQKFFSADSDAKVHTQVLKRLKEVEQLLDKAGVK
ncbi:MAG: MBL fold metallo-hydrolase [Firmicutes bacterium]|nr:MBL fold metallo-hydrolase [Bacillota bacterium]